MPLNPDIDPTGFHLPGSEVAALMIHGLIGAPLEMRKVADFLNQRGLTILAPLLPGHGASAKDLNNYGWFDCTDTVTSTHEKMKEEH